MLHTTMTDEPVMRRKVMERFAAPNSGWVGMFPHDTELDRLWWELRGSHSHAVE
ncbi:hypothetical protein [Streptomyces sp. Isolate_219]|uniref:hypothetical protein n=1 Tax=Streptomyces sp. Isolate_219 TaxID=2950110 RepID=UPI0021C920ED|nr:hypothetical protein [Streptomyces sp. Isolate_219]MCR8573563.1 hypothetical protein [Streptomyces sp. Isolate_219]